MSDHFYHSDSERDEQIPQDPDVAMEIVEKRKEPPLSARKTGKKRASSQDCADLHEEELAMRRTQIYRGFNVAVEFAGRRGEKRRAIFENQFFPSKVNKMTCFTFQRPPR